MGLKIRILLNVSTRELINSGRFSNSNPKEPVTTREFPIVEQVEEETPFLLRLNLKFMKRKGFKDSNLNKPEFWVIQLFNSANEGSNYLLIFGFSFLVLKEINHSKVKGRPSRAHSKQRKHDSSTRKSVWKFY